jgi:3-hydroxybutyryl-CoA dehydratase
MNNYKLRDIQVGLTEHFEVVVEQHTLDQFILISNDDNPIHLDANAAVARGFKGRVVHGLLTGAFYSTLVGVHLPGEYSVLQTISIKFRHPVYVNERLVVQGTVTHISESVNVIEIAGGIRNENNQLVSTANITAGVSQ